MYTAKEYEKLSGEAAQNHFGLMAAGLYGKNWRSAFAEEVGMTVDGVANWMRKGNRPTTIAMIYLDTRVRLKAAEGTLTGLATAMDGLKRYLPTK